MERVSSFLEKHAKADSTEVCSEVAQPVVQEIVKPHEHVETAEAIDRERHIHHHQHRIQPVAAKEVLPTQHETIVVPEVTKEMVTEMDEDQRARLLAVQTQHKDTRTVAETQRSTAHMGVSVNEHVHHHVHEYIQPIIQKETIAAKTVHTIIPIHEKIHEAPIVHESTVLPMMTMEEFRAKLGGTGSHGSNDHKHAFYSGIPKVSGTESADMRHGSPSSTHGRTFDNNSSRLPSSSNQNQIPSQHQHSSSRDHSTIGGGGGIGAGATGAGTGRDVNALDKNGDRNHHTGKDGVQPVHKSQMANKLDPRVDSDRTAGRA